MFWESREKLNRKRDYIVIGIKNIVSIGILFSSLLFSTTDALVPNRVDIAVEKNKYGMILVDVNYTTKVGFIDTSGRWVVSPILDRAKNFAPNGVIYVWDEKCKRKR